MYLDWEIFEKYRAEVLKHFGYVLLSPLGILIVNLLLNGFKFFDNFMFSFFLSLMSGFFGYVCVVRSLEVMYNLNVKAIRNANRTSK